MKIKCTVCNKEFYYGDHNSPMFIDEVWNSIADAAHWLVDNGYAKTYNGGVR